MAQLEENSIMSQSSTIETLSSSSRIDCQLAINNL